MLNIFFAAITSYFVKNFVSGKEFGQINTKQTTFEREDSVLLKLTRRLPVEVHQFNNYYHSKELNNLRTEKKGKPGIHKISAFFMVSINKYTYKIDLLLNKNLLSHNYSVTSYSAEGNQQTKKEKARKNNCFYQGKVRELNESTVIANTCDGLKTYILLPNSTVAIEASDNGHSTMYPLYYDQIDLHIDFGGDESVFRKKNSYKRLQKIYSKDKQKVKISLTQPIVELMMVVDFESYNKHGSVEAVEAYVKNTVNLVDGFYHAINIRVVLTHIEIWNQGNKINLSNASKKLLNNFKNYRLKKLFYGSSSSPWVQADTIHLIYGGKFKDKSLGIAYVFSMCDVESLAVVVDLFKPWLTATVVAHEMGHTFAVPHDTFICYCPSANSCIMAAATVFNIPHSWSSCSIVSFKQYFVYNEGACLQNHPENLFSKPHCGNNVIERGEQCDCGSSGRCFNKCCNPKTCRYLPGVTCDSGACCHKCQLQKDSYMCREVNGECDLPEFCTGNSPFCPDNLHVEDGVSCANGDAICYNGSCATRDHLCFDIWGYGSNNADKQCYNAFKKNEIVQENCNQSGLQDGCLIEHYKCSVLFCSGGKNYTSKKYLEERFLTENNQECKGIRYDHAINVSLSVDQSPSIDGTTCGEGRICVDYKCQEKTLLKCTKTCNGNGVCNNLGKCHCDVGWLTPFCNKSIDAIVRKNVRAKLSQAPYFKYVVFVSVLLLFISFFAFQYALSTGLIYGRHYRRLMAVSPVPSPTRS